MQSIPTCQVLGLGTAVPPHFLKQKDFLERMLRRPLDRRSQRFLESIIPECGIDSRHTVLSLSESGSPTYQGKSIEGAGTAVRNAIFHNQVLPLASEAAHGAFRQSKVSAGEITHLIFTTCTGFTNPGADFSLITELGLSPHVHRYVVGFMGCFGAFPTLELAKAISLADPKAKILCVCAELCSLHFMPNDTLDDILAASLFADGVAACVVGRSSSDCRGTGLSIGDYGSFIVPDSETEMAWSIGDQGFNLRLAPTISRIVGKNIRNLIDSHFNASGSALGWPNRWIVHPGGRGILDRVQESLELAPDALDSSRQILSQFGNMSSATVLFILETVVGSRSLRDNETIGLLGFGPGISVKSLMLKFTTP